MKRALIIGASGGIGQAVARELELRGADVTGVSRSTDGLDVTDEASIVRAFSALSGPFDAVFIAVGALEPSGEPPEKAIRDVSPANLAQSFAVNAIGPMLVLKHVLPLVPKDAPSVMAVLSARVGSIGDNRIGGWHSYRASKAALNQLVHGAAIELKRTHKAATLVCLHPGTVATAFTRKYAASHKTTPPDQAARNLVDVMAGLTPAQTGGFFDFAGKEIPW